MQHVETCYKYFKVFSNQDHEGLAEMFHPEVYLRDWDNQYDGKDAVVAANKAIFDSVDTILVVPGKQAAQVDEASGVASVYNEIEVHVNGGEEVLLVLAAIEIDLETGLIKAVREFKGRTQP